MLREEEKKLSGITGYRVKIQEINGTQIRRILCRKNPFQGIPCQRPTCMVCKEGGKGDCRRRSITYQTTCDTCKARNAAAGVENTPENVGSYWGESYRSAAERSAEHLHDLNAKKEDSHMWKHKLLEHPEEEVSFTMKVLKKHYSAFERMVTESTLITHNYNTSNILNSKSGYNRSCIPRLTVSMGQSVVADPLRSTEYPNTEVEQIIETDDRRKKKSRGRDRGDTRGDNENIHLPQTNPPAKRRKYQAKRNKIYTSSLIPNPDRSDPTKEGTESFDQDQIAEQTQIELDHNEHKASKPSNLNLNLFPIFQTDGVGASNLSSEAPSSGLRIKREIIRKPRKLVKNPPCPANNSKITDHFRPKLGNSNRPNESGIVVEKKEEIETSSVLDESVTRPIGL